MFVINTMYIAIINVESTIHNVSVRLTVLSPVVQTRGGK